MTDTSARHSRRWVAHLSEMLVALVAGCSIDTPAPDPSVAAVEISPSAAVLPITESLQLTATPRDPAYAPLSGRKVTWSSSATEVAVVNGFGLVTGMSPGVATITATSEGKSGTAAVTVTPGPATELRRSRETATSG